MSESRKMNKKDHKKKNKGDQNPTLCDIVTEQSLEKNYKILGKVIFRSVIVPLPRHIDIVFRVRELKGC